MVGVVAAEYTARRSSGLENVGIIGDSLKRAVLGQVSGGMRRGAEGRRSAESAWLSVDVELDQAVDQRMITVGCSRARRRPVRLILPRRRL